MFERLFQGLLSFKPEDIVGKKVTVLVNLGSQELFVALKVKE
jgi:hypothetical protein